MRVYDEVFVPRMFTPWAELLLDEIALRAGEAVLDVATGPGTVARVAAQRVGSSGHVHACDLSPAMLALARSKGGSAQALRTLWASPPIAPKIAELSADGQDELERTATTCLARIVVGGEIRTITT